MNNNEQSPPVKIKNISNRNKRIDSIGTPDSPFRILLFNLFKKTNNGTGIKKNEQQKNSTIVQ